jgi:hypothetical protein
MATPAYPSDQSTTFLAKVKHMNKVVSKPLTITFASSWGIYGFSNGVDRSLKPVPFWGWLF